MQQLLFSGRLLDLVLVAMLIEALALIVIHRRSGRGPAPLLVVTMLASGGGLLLALRAALTQSSYVAIALPMSVALLAHVADLWARWRR